MAVLGHQGETWVELALGLLGRVRKCVGVAGTFLLTRWNEWCRLEQDLLNLCKGGHRPFPLLPPSTSRQRCYCSMQVDQGWMRVRVLDISNGG
jgi:hypothetical protein